MERPSFLSPTAPGARKNVRARLAARKENVSPPSPDEVAAALKARQDLAAANRENVLSARKEKAVASATPRKTPPADSTAERKKILMAKHEAAAARRTRALQATQVAAAGSSTRSAAAVQRKKELRERKRQCINQNCRARV